MMEVDIQWPDKESYTRDDVMAIVSRASLILLQGMISEDIEKLEVRKKGIQKTLDGWNNGQPNAVKPKGKKAKKVVRRLKCKARSI